MVAIEGWLQLGADPKPAYVTLEGYVLRTTKSDAPGSPTLQVLDLRHCDSISPLNAYEPTGAVEIASKSGKGKSATSMVLACADPEQNELWLSHLCSAVPDRAVASVLRHRFRQDAEVIGLMRAHSSQLSAAGMTPSKYDKARKKSLLKKASTGLASASSVGDALAAARERRAAGSGGGGEEVSDAEAAASDATAASQSGRSAAGRGGALDGELSAAAERRLSMAAEEYYEDSGEDSSDDGFPAMGIATSDRAPSMARISEPAGPEESEHDEHEGGWWFIKTSDGSISGPISKHEMRRRYHLGKVTHQTVVRLVPRADDGDDAEAPTAEAQRAERFSVLQELCTAAGPPFLVER